MQVPVYVAEITPKNLRGAFTTVNQLICCGVSVTYLVGAVISHGTDSLLLECLHLYFSSWACFSFLNLLDGWLKVGYTETLQQLPESNLIDLLQRKYAHSFIVRASNRVVIWPFLF
ncbi:PREDICTED: sugar transporter ERD6-like 7 [Ipomoea nil]|uniref:sugar transporter ERD6-like 7 n=1 Tax=Ipomoea nil TaxID=35883 RepID=UPI000900F545|nr:PREDICTED: sugar transporter ERD6-like 7 [Ipomoea nil]